MYNMCVRVYILSMSRREPLGRSKKKQTTRIPFGDHPLELERYRED